MAITPAASGNHGKAAPSTLEGMSSEPITTDASIEMESAPPPAAPLESLRPGVPMGSAVAGDGASDGTPPESLGSPNSSVELATAAPEESSAEHLAGSSAAVVNEMDAKFAHLLHEVHQNRPGD